MEKLAKTSSGIKFSVGDDDEDTRRQSPQLPSKQYLAKFNKKRRQSEIILPFRGSTAERLNEAGKLRDSPITREEDEEKEEGGMDEEEEEFHEDEDEHPHPLHIFTLGTKAPLELRRTIAPTGKEGRQRGLIHVLGKNSGSVPNISQKAKESENKQIKFASQDSPEQKKEEPAVAFVTSSSAAVGLQQVSGQGNQLPRTLSTSVLRIKQKRSFWEKVVGHGTEDVIVTPFAQILASLRSVRNNYIQLNHASLQRSTKSNQSTGSNAQDIDDFHAKLSLETLEEMDWCLEQLETIQTHRSVSDMASSKFKRMLNKELSHFSESKSGNQISEYICNTFLDKQQECDIPLYSTFPPKPAASNTAQSQGILHLPQQLAKTTVAAAAAASSQAQEDSLASSASASAASAQQKQLAVAAAEERKQISLASGPMGVISGVKPDLVKPVPASKPIPRFGVETRSEDENKLEEMMLNVDRWGVDIFSLSDITNSRPLTAVTFTIFQERDLMKTFQISEHTFVSFLMTVEDHYHPNVPYHNNKHAADVTQSMHVLLNSPALEVSRSPNASSTFLPILVSFFAILNF